MKYTLITSLILLLSSGICVAGAGEKGNLTPYPFVFGGNSYSGARNATVTWLAQRYDGAINFGDWPGLDDSIWDTANALGYDFEHGSYASIQELNLYSSGWSDSSYDARIADADPFWLVYYAQHYMDSIGVSIESLYVHYDDDTTNITNTDGTRGYNLTVLDYYQTRFSYQYWANNSGDTFMYPAGYCWLANGYNTNTREAIAYAYRRHFIEDSISHGHRNTFFFMDNQYRGGTAPRLPTYYTINYTFGGPTSVMDWVEESQIENDATSLLNYYDNSTLMLDSAMKTTLDSVCNSAGIDSIYGFANVDKFNASHFAVQIKRTNTLFEAALDYTQTWAKYKQYYIVSDTMGNRNSGGANQRYHLWTFRGDFLVNEGTWRTSNRMYYAHYAFYLTIYHSNIYISPARFNDTLRWRDIYEVNLGDPVLWPATGSWAAYGEGHNARTDTAGSGGDYGTTNYVIRRKFYNSTSGDTTLILFRSGYNGGETTDGITVDLDGDYYQIDINADTSAATVSSITLYPYQGWVGIQGLSGFPAPTTATQYRGIDIKGIEVRP